MEATDHLEGGQILNTNQQYIEYLSEDKIPSQRYTALKLPKRSKFFANSGFIEPIAM